MKLFLALDKMSFGKIVATGLTSRVDFSVLGQLILTRGSLEDSAGSSLVPWYQGFF